MLGPGTLADQILLRQHRAGGKRPPRDDAAARWRRAMVLVHVVLSPRPPRLGVYAVLFRKYSGRAYPSRDSDCSPPASVARSPMLFENHRAAQPRSRQHCHPPHWSEYPSRRSGNVRRSAVMDRDSLRIRGRIVQHAVQQRQLPDSPRRSTRPRPPRLQAASRRRPTAPRLSRARDQPQQRDVGEIGRRDLERRHQRVRNATAS